MSNRSTTHHLIRHSFRHCVRSCAIVGLCFLVSGCFGMFSRDPSLGLIDDPISDPRRDRVSVQALGNEHADTRYLGQPLRSETPNQALSVVTDARAKTEVTTAPSLHDPKTNARLDQLQNQLEEMKSLILSMQSQQKNALEKANAKTTTNIATPVSEPNNVHRHAQTDSADIADAIDSLLERSSNTSAIANRTPNASASTIQPEPAPLLTRFNGESNNRYASTGPGYGVGPGDILRIRVFQVEDLSRTVRVGEDGFIMVPLLGQVFVHGLTTSRIEMMLAHEFEQRYLQNPQVSVFIEEYESKQVTVLGAVRNPSVYSIRKPENILAMLAKAGGLTEQAGTNIQINRELVISPTMRRKETLIISKSALLANADQLQDLVLSEGDSILVSKSGSVFIEGAIENPGAYPMHGETNIVKLLSMAGGILYDTAKKKIEIYRKTPSGEQQVFRVNYNTARQDPRHDIILEEGDVVVVHHSRIKRGLAGFWKGLSGMFSLSYSI